jgi:hypothetical protein
MTETERLAACPETEWQPIDTATKDGHARLVWVPETRCIYCVTWVVGDSKRPAGWMVFGGGWRDIIQHPTHWQPLPLPPPSSREG